MPDFETQNDLLMKAYKSAQRNAITMLEESVIKRHQGDVELAEALHESSMAMNKIARILGERLNDPNPTTVQ